MREYWGKGDRQWREEEGSGGREAEGYGGRRREEAGGGKWREIEGGGSGEKLRETEEVEGGEG
jgi:hypothetical protein